MSDVAAQCAGFADDLPELALGALSGRERADALAHVESCPRCAAELDRLTHVADSLLQAVPGADPPLGFEVRVLDQLGLSRPRRPRRRRVALALSAAAVAAGGFVVGLVVSSTPQASTPIAAMVFSGTKLVGSAVLSPGHPGSLAMTVVNLGSTSEVTCTITTRSGAVDRLGWFWLAGGSGVWSVPLSTPAGSVRSAVLAAPSGRVVAEATFSA